MSNLGFLRFADCDTSCLIGVAIAFALFIGVLSSTLFSTEQVFDYEGQKTKEEPSSSASSKFIPFGKIAPYLMTSTGRAHAEEANPQEASRGGCSG
jgi:hypothetical protein